MGVLVFIQMDLIGLRYQNIDFLIMDFLSKHPIDWIIHFILCFLPVKFRWAKWFVVFFVILLVEYEQWSCSGRPPNWWTFDVAIGDIFFSLLGIIIGLIKWNGQKRV